MKTLWAISCICYSIVLLLCALFAGRDLTASRNRNDSSEEGSAIRILAVVCGVVVTAYHLVSRRPFAGNYVVHMAFALSPMFLPRLAADGGRLSLIPAAATLVLTAAAAGVSFVCPAVWDAGWAALTLTAGCVIAFTGRTIWRHSGTMRRFDGALSAKETLDDFADILYSTVLILFAFLAMTAGNRACWPVLAVSAVCTAAVCALVEALYFRRRRGRVFVLCREREDVFMENFRMYAGISRRDAAKLNVSCENLFMRLKEYFDRRMPYLDPELTLNDVAKSLLTNKMYLSKTINECTGKNFCQFVNYYRVKYAVRLFLSNNSYKIADLTVKSGFNTERAFMMAFRLYMNVSPSQWCKINRGKSPSTADAVPPLKK